MFLLAVFVPATVAVVVVAASVAVGSVVLTKAESYPKDSIEVGRMPYSLKKELHLALGGRTCTYAVYN